MLPAATVGREGDLCNKGQEAEGGRMAFRDTAQWVKVGPQRGAVSPPQALDSGDTEATEASGEELQARD